MVLPSRTSHAFQKGLSVQTGKTQPPCGSVGTLPAPQVWFSHSSDLPALPIMRFTISQSAQWKSGPKNLNHSIKFIVKIIIIRKEDNCHWHGFLFVLQNFFLLNINCAWHGIQGKNLAGLGDFYSVFFLSAFLSILSVSTVLWKECERTQALG